VRPTDKIVSVGAATRKAQLPNELLNKTLA